MNKINIISENDLKHKLNDFAKSMAGKSSTDWTIGIKVFFSKYFNDLVRKFYPNQVFCTAANKLGKLGDKQWDYVDYPNEYIYDLIIFREDKSEEFFKKFNIRLPFLTKTFLALECEWGDEKQIIDDFQKLLISNADYKVMVFDANKINLDGVLEFMKKNISDYPELNGTFILACFVNQNKGFSINFIKTTFFP